MSQRAARVELHAEDLLEFRRLLHSKQGYGLGKVDAAAGCRGHLGRLPSLLCDELVGDGHHVDVNEAGKKFSAWLAIHFPILKDLFKANILSSFSRTLSVLLGSGIPLEKAMEITASTTNNYIYAECFREICKKIGEGNDLSLSLSNYPDYFNKSFVKMIDIGEVSGSLEENLMYLHDFYAEEVDEMSENLVTLIQPLLLIFIGVLIGGLALLVLMPIYQLMGSINA